MAGEVDIATVDTFATVVLDAVSASPGRRVVLELNRVAFFAAAGLGVVLTAHQQAAGRGGELALVVDQVAPCASTMRFLSAQECPPVFSTLTAALSCEVTR